MNKTLPRIKLPAWVARMIVPALGKVRRSITPGVAAVLVLLIFLLASSVKILHFNNRHIATGISDEYLTLYQGVKYLNPLGEPNDNYTGGETTRWFARLLFPGGIYYMNSRLGGVAWVFSTLNSGVAYLEEHYRLRENLTRAEHMTTVRNNPGVQDFVFFMRVSFGLLAVAACCLALWALSRRFHPAAAAAYGALILNSSPAGYNGYIDTIVFGHFHKFYGEVTLFLLFNLAVFLCLQRGASYRRVAYSGVLAAAALSTKLMGVVIAAPLFIYAAFARPKRGERLKLRVEVFFLCFAAAMFLIHLNAFSIEEIVHDTMWDVFHYKSGDSGIPAPGGSDFFWLLMRDAGWFVMPLFLVALLWLARAPKLALAPAYVLGAGVIASFASLLDASWYLPRNASFLYVAMSFIIALAVGDLMKKTLAHKSTARLCASLGLGLALAASALSLAGNLPSAGDTLFTKKQRHAAACKNIGAFGLTAAELRRLRETARGGVTALPGIRAPFKVQADVYAPFWVVRRLLGGNKPVVLAEEYHKKWQQQYDCLVVRRDGHAKQLTNHFAPHHYRLEGGRVYKLKHICRFFHKEK